jgi:DNA invertase Pin-like site-specific DNA recombinase
MNSGTRVLGYARVSTADQVETGHGLAAQEAAISQECATRGWELAEIVRDEGESGKTLDRAGLTHALQAIADGHATGLVVSKLDRLSRSVADFAALLEWFTAASSTLVALDLGIDTSTPGGRLVANVFASVAEWEREVIAARTKEGLRAARASGTRISGPAVSDQPKLQRRIRRLRTRGHTLQAIADRLNKEGVPTLRGGTEWRPSSIQTAAGLRRRRTRRRAVDLPDPGKHSADS